MPPDLYWFDIPNVDEAPDEPGIYAWYVVPIAGEYALAEDLADGQDLAVARFGEFLSSHSRRLRHPDFRIQATGHLWAEWRGEITETGSQRLSHAIDRIAEGTGEAGKHLSRSMRAERTRRVLAQVLIEAAPRLVAPVYIGVATSLRERLATHVRTFRTVKKLLADEKPIPTKHLNTFGERAASSKFLEDEMRVGVYPVPALDDDLDEALLRQVAEAAEFVLNRWHHPILGRR